VGTELPDGAYVQNEWFSRYGMTVTAYPEGSSFSGGVEALVVQLNNTNDKVLTIPTTGLPGQDMPHEAGGNLTFTFDTPAVEVFAIGLIDLDPAATGGGGNWTLIVEKADDSGTLVVRDIPLLPSGSSSLVVFQNETIDEDNVRSVTVVMRGQGAIGFLVVCVDDRPSASPSQSPAPSVSPSESPSSSSDPSNVPSEGPSESMSPSREPSDSPSKSPYPSEEPSNSPSKSAAPSVAPSESPSRSPGTVSGHLYLDTNGNGSQDPSEPDLPFVDVVVTDKDGNTQVVETDAHGNWSASVPAGETMARTLTRMILTFQRMWCRRRVRTQLR
jgi:hypothetical protein